MLFTGNVIALLLAFTSNTADVSVKLQLSQLAQAEARQPLALDLTAGVSTDHRLAADGGGASRMDTVHPMSVGAPATNIERVPVGKGFLFFEGRYLPETTKLFWKNGRVSFDDPTGSMLAMANTRRGGPPVPRPFRRNVKLDSGQSLHAGAMGSRISFGLSASEMKDVSFALSTGGVVCLSRTSPPLTAGHSEGGYELLEALNLEPGPERNEILTAALPRVRSGVTAETKTWLSNLQPDGELAERVDTRVEQLRNMETANRGAATAVRRLNSWNYPLTVAAMMIFVVSIGTLLSARPQELVAVAHTEQDVSINRFLVLIAGMSVIDLIWTLLAHQANQISEVNPVGNVLLGDTMRTIVFKGLATAMAIGIFHRTRQNAFARKACWWVCLTLALLMARWVLVSGVSI